MRYAHRAGLRARMRRRVLPAHPIISASVATASTGRSSPRVYEAIEQLTSAGVLIPLSSGKRNRWWEAEGMIELIEGVESSVAFIARS